MRRIDAREVFAEGLEAMLAEMSFDKVRVTELCRRAEATPPTFYRYFRDKHELVAWVFVRDFVGAYDGHGPGYSAERLDGAMAAMESRAGFYKAAWADRSQNSIAEYIQEFNLQIAGDAVRRATGRGLTRGQELEVRYHSFGVVCLFMEWLAKGMPATRAELARLMMEKTPAFLAEAFAAFPYDPDELLAMAQRPGA